MLMPNQALQRTAPDAAIAELIRYMSKERARVRAVGRNSEARSGVVQGCTLYGAKDAIAPHDHALPIGAIRLTPIAPYRAEAWRWA